LTVATSTSKKSASCSSVAPSRHSFEERLRCQRRREDARVELGLIPFIQGARLAALGVARAAARCLARSRYKIAFIAARRSNLPIFGSSSAKNQLGCVQSALIEILACRAAFPTRHHRSSARTAP
jgi:hypothetical protein